MTAQYSCSYGTWICSGLIIKAERMESGYLHLESMSEILTYLAISVYSLQITLARCH